MKLQNLSTCHRRCRTEWQRLCESSGTLFCSKKRVSVFARKLTGQQMGIESKEIAEKQQQPPVTSVDDDRYSPCIAGYEEDLRHVQQAAMRRLVPCLRQAIQTRSERCEILLSLSIPCLLPVACFPSIPQAAAREKAAGARVSASLLGPSAERAALRGLTDPCGRSK